MRKDIFDFPLIEDELMHVENSNRINRMNSQLESIPNQDRNALKILILFDKVNRREVETILSVVDHALEEY